ncbi:alpha/beta fold hydrolase [Nakamurella leprariae]|uniref:Alpha/beta fold hydrolase n=1 Tax=Nakamurella leprariae TaxID=2803911 RepID=A0A938YHX9_9ACTN|nr:alpha/beta fold hydrolase [Nakamurella leprariae]MBM9468125.1 alpha/beta fold hydrolase [Nakamurella leprariae]
MPPTTTEFVALPHGAVRVVEAGSGPVVVYLHGVGDQGELLPALASLAADHRVLRPDHPGFVESDDAAVNSVRELASLQLAVLDRLVVQEFDLIGCSLGGWVAVELALLAGDRVRSLTLIDAAGLAGDGSAPDIFATDPATMLRLTVHDEQRREAARTAPPDAVVSRRLQRSRETARRIAADPYMHDPSLPDRARVISVPVQVFWGAQDGVIPVSYATAWSAVFPTADVQIIDRAGHLPHVERPEEFLSRSFLDGRSPVSLPDGRSPVSTDSSVLTQSGPA